MRLKVKGFNHVTGKKYDGMMGRCYRESDASYKNYGLKGIRVCTAWVQNIENFREWVKKELDKYNLTIDEFVSKSSYYQLDRIDHKGHYTPDNCRIVTIQENSRNKQNGKRKYETAEGTIVEV